MFLIGNLFGSGVQLPDPTASAPVAAPPSAPPTHEGCFTSLAEAIAVAGIINAQPNPPGGGVLAWNADPAKSGIYVEDFMPVPGTPLQYSGTAVKPYMLRFRNASTELAGLVAGIMAFSPAQWPAILAESLR